MKIYADPSQNQNPNIVKSENPNAFSDSLTNPTEKEKLKDLHGAKKFQYIWDYYKTPIILGIIILLVISYTVYDRLHAKETVVTITCANVSMDDGLSQTLSEDFLKNYVNLGTSKYQIVVDSNLTVGEEGNALDPTYAYSSQMKLMAYIASGQMDLVLMNQGGFDHLSQNGFLQDLTEIFADLDPDLNEILKESLVTNEVVLEDNAREVSMDPSIEYKAVTETYPLALKLTGTKLFPEGYFTQDVFLGIAVNTEKKEAALQYIHYLFDLEPGDLNLFPETK